MERRASLALLLVCLAAYGYFVLRGPTHNPDSRLALTYSLVERATLTIDPYAASTADRALRDGHYYSDKAPGVSLALAPLYALLRAAGLPDKDATQLGERFIARYLLTFLGVGAPGALFATWLFHWLRRDVPDPGARAATVVGYALGSPVWAYTAHAFGHVPAGMALFGGFALLRDTDPTSRRLIAAGSLFALAVYFEYPAAVPALALAALGIARSEIRWATAGALAAGALPPLIALGAYHTLAFGAPWLTGYAFLDPASPYAAAQREGLLGIRWPDPVVALQLIAGEYRGLLWTTPWLILAVPGALILWRRRRRHDVIAAAAVTLGLLAVNAGYAVWHGGAAWGPRHLVPAMPFLALLSAPAAARWRPIAWALSCAGVLLSLAVVASGALPPEDLRATLREYLWPNVTAGRVTNSWGQLAGLTAWRAVAPLGLIALACWAWARGLRHTYGFVLAIGITLVTAAQLDRRYLEFTEGYFLYLGARMADGAVLYRDTASTQPPLLPWVISLLWRLLPDVWLPRLLALACYAGAALLAGKLALRIGGHRAMAPLATAIAAVLPLGASTPHALDANAVSAVLAPAIVLLVGGSLVSVAVAGAVAAVGIATKLTFLPLALAPGAVLLLQGSRREALVYAATLGAGTLAISAATLAVSGTSAVEALTGELGSRLLPAGAMLAVTHLVHLEVMALAAASVAWWRWRRDPGTRLVWVMTLVAALHPLFAVHEGTFVGVARPLEPFAAAWAAVAIHEIGTQYRTRTGAWLRPTAAIALLAALVVRAVPSHVDRALTSDPTVEWAGLLPAEGAIAPPYYAAIGHRTLRRDHPYWPVWGRRAAAGREPDRGEAEALVRDLEAGRLDVVIADFRLAYLPGAIEALDRGHERVAAGGSAADPSLAVYRLRSRISAGTP